MSIDYVVSKAGPLSGEFRVPGDKSISHRSVIFGALADGVTEIRGFLDGLDCLATRDAFRAMGVRIDGPDAGCLRIHGVGMAGLTAPDQPLDLGNSGTSMRLLAGLLCAQPFDSALTGDASLSRRPMRRVIDPLSRMGAMIHGSDNGTPPLEISGGRLLHGIHHISPVASAQVKSALLLAGLYATGETRIDEPAPSRDHTERMLEAFGYPIHRESLSVRLSGGHRLRAASVEVPADLSSAAFFLVGASITPGSEILLRDVGINPTRTGVIQILRAMGADIRLERERMFGAEPVADLRVRAAPLHGIEIPEALVPLAIDEFPALFVAAAYAEGETVLTGAAELRVKESDRIQVMADGLARLGALVDPRPDGIRIQGGTLKSGRIESHGDHRIAMAFAMAALRAEGTIEIGDCNNVETSFPGFANMAVEAGLTVSTVFRDA
ncbi:3-phosphoshikimate 1-carboxyvinyltransferase [Candidatus Macondimonas diazotrophica]|uniref:3-phosphoshikimate 1-carboxyvinyltransferase n=1 Tax=Candidatus Macondimonas diazotrophica TaxID=2305248 RepID=A0A4Z0FCW1_9GAMM|nr:3-phosphoshikimate 1-carboxyvinyltransferase [Candidatus Macondimonas diazotrophica]NCU00077.1 3-phosphoshikimate 1-carboxyvinyltransferase [Candidatus Macondimonas diazotrophica]TFZ83862.1 3-phosphoshikimate 1-carboxyvinyltransferase [Candidatus Macondimonas diazotrophica]HBG31664.1 3-phosphoshikimate 1-carboxyvinyltransferase [Gammaproteobacteria bacterium]HBG52005.1 3-phosphoshikimate 1-carboxyvinyltransferase [Gammaproteobacteria bacterium]